MKELYEQLKKQIKQIENDIDAIELDAIPEVTAEWVWVQCSGASRIIAQSLKSISKLRAFVLDGVE